MLLAFDIVHAFKGVHEVIKYFNKGIYWGDGWLHDILVFEENGVRVAIAVSSLDKYNVCATVFRESTDAPAIHGMFTPCVTAITFDMESHCTPMRSKWQSVVIEMAMVVGVGGDFGGYVGLAKKIQGGWFAE